MIQGLRRACAIALCALGAGCASMSDNECRSANWYERGMQDGLIGLQPRLDVYSSQCTRYGVQPAANDYLEGWQSGNFEHFKRSDQHMG
jgi:hypothetical protein